MTQPYEQPVVAPYEQPAVVEAAPVVPAPVEAAPVVAPVEIPAPVTVPAEPTGVLHVSACAMCPDVPADDHPKHVFVLNVFTGEETRRHMDCCASVGCPVCANAIKDAGGVTGHELRAHITGQASA